jgi:RNAse (barnase) inhibitor barstar
LSAWAGVLPEGWDVNVIIDGRFVLDEADLHHRMAGSFGYGPMYSHSFESLRDHLAGGDPRPLLLTWIHSGSIRLALGSAVFERYVGMLEQVAVADEGQDWNRRFVFRLLE